MLTRGKRRIALLSSLLLTLALSAPAVAHDAESPSAKDLPKCGPVEEAPRLSVSPEVIPVGTPTEVTVRARSAKGKPLPNLSLALTSAYASESLTGTTDAKGQMHWTVTVSAAEAMKVEALDDSSIKPGPLYALDAENAAVAVAVEDRCGEPLLSEVTVTPDDPAQTTTFSETEAGTVRIVQPLSSAVVSATAQAEDGQVAYFLYQHISARAGRLTKLTLSAEHLKPTYVSFQADGAPTDGQLYLLPQGMQRPPWWPVVEHEQVLYALRGAYQYVVVGAAGTAMIAGEADLRRSEWAFAWRTEDLVPVSASSTLEGNPVTVRGIGLQYGPFTFGLANGGRVAPGAYGITSLYVVNGAPQFANFIRTEPEPLLATLGQPLERSWDLTLGELSLKVPPSFTPGTPVRVEWQEQTVDGWTLLPTGSNQFEITVTDPDGAVIVDTPWTYTFYPLRLPASAAPFYTLTVTRAATWFSPEKSVTTTIYRR